MITLHPMRARRSTYSTRWYRALVIAFATAAGMSGLPALSAVPPPLGPAATVQKANTPELGTGVLRLLVQGRAQQIVDAINADLAAQGKSYRASVAAVTASAPGRTATQAVDEPNQFFVRQPFSIAIEVDIPWAFDRTVHLPLDIDAFCDGWHRSGGLMRFFSRPGPISVEGGNIIEEVLHVRDIIDAKVRASFPSLGNVEEPQLNALADLKGRACATVGVSLTPNVEFDAILWSHPLHLPPTVSQQRIDVTPISLRRLVARRLDTGGPVGEPIENVSLETWANFHVSQTAQMALRENDQVALNQPAMVLYGEPTTSLVVIGNVLNTLFATSATAFAVSQQSASYSPGTHILQIMTEYSIPPAPPRRKPLKVTVATYELTYNVKYTPPLTDPGPILN